jgi:hypothetical protein
MEYVALSDQVSAHADSPTAFDAFGELEVKEGEPLFNQLQWQLDCADVSMYVRHVTHASGCISDRVFRGVFSTREHYDFPTSPDLQIEFERSGALRIEIESR